MEIYLVLIKFDQILPDSTYVIIEKYVSIIATCQHYRAQNLLHNRNPVAFILHCT